MCSASSESPSRQSPVHSGAEVICSVTAADSLGHELDYLWTAEGVAGSFDDATSATPTWTAPATAGDCEITVIVTCAGDVVGQSTTQVTVTATDDGQRTSAAFDAGQFLGADSG